MTTVTAKHDRVGPDAYERMRANLVAKHADTKKELARLTEDLTSLTVAAETDPSPENLKKLSAVERRYTKLAADLASLDARMPSLAEKLDEARTQADFERRQMAGREYIMVRDEIHERQQRMIALADEMLTEAKRVRELAGVADKAGHQAWGNVADVDSGNRLQVMAAYIHGAVTGRSRSESGVKITDLRDSLLGPWRSNRGPLAAQLADLGI